MAEVMQRVNQALYHDSRREEFATLFYATLDRPTRTLTFVNAGHNHPILVREGECRPLRTGGLPIGLFPDAQYSEEQIQLQDGDVVLIYTDGFTEVPNAKGHEFGRARLQQLVRSHRNLSAEKLVALLEDRVAAFAGNPEETGFEDDRTAVAITVPSFLPE
jgi:sigma-B regulation protein RsbU (phosphoserine phosphatase)